MNKEPTIRDSGTTIQETLRSLLCDDAKIDKNYISCYNVTCEECVLRPDNETPLQAQFIAKVLRVGK